jgi:flagellar hook-associated protein 3 FlgL
MTTRVSTAQLFQGGQERIAQARGKEVRSSEQASTQKQLLKVSEDPTAWVHAANLKNDLALQESISKNAASANHVLTATETLLAEVQNSAQRAHELAISASSSTGNGGLERKAVLSEVESLYENVIRTLNTRYGGRTLLAGFKSEGPAFDRSGKFVGDSHEFNLEINRDLKVPLNISTEQSIQGEGMGDGVNIPEVWMIYSKPSIRFPSPARASVRV